MKSLYNSRLSWFGLLLCTSGAIILWYAGTSLLPYPLDDRWILFFLAILIAFVIVWMGSLVQIIVLSFPPKVAHAICGLAGALSGLVIVWRLGLLG